MPDDKLGWINRPGTYLSTEAGGVPNDFPRRSQPSKLDTPSKTKQRAEVLVVGCSFTQGFGVTDDETFSYLLNARYPRLMFHNFGTGGYGTYQSLLRIRRESHATVQRIFRW